MKYGNALDGTKTSGISRRRLAKIINGFAAGSRRRDGAGKETDRRFRTAGKGRIRFRSAFPAGPFGERRRADAARIKHVRRAEPDHLPPERPTS